MGKHSDFRISSFRKVVSMHDEFCSPLTEKLKNIFLRLYMVLGDAVTTLQSDICVDL